MKELYATNFAGQIVYEDYTTLMGDDEGYQEYLDRANKEVDNDEETVSLVTLFEAKNVGKKAVKEIKSIDHKDIREIIKNHNVVMMLTLMACFNGDEKLYYKILKLRGGSLLEPIAELKKLVNNKNLFEIPLEELFLIFKDNDFTGFFSKYRDS